MDNSSGAQRKRSAKYQRHAHTTMRGSCARAIDKSIYPIYNFYFGIISAIGTYISAVATCKRYGAPCKPSVVDVVVVVVVVVVVLGRDGLPTLDVSRAPVATDMLCT